ncbi:hypothetical protein O7627_22020 [Solwaraspora sp. WMMD1047]|uniref:hypothetical protein n=1 Tax=Solwaraspora sp. WMMD1047 TaxID=3016102 RepID=UPI002416A0A2|nr:hypothetical protein [Solwaraspora sp. WMMD1047]MDG4831962.1 hypothetical protein [Solwaraspora sp. WMMD1047]
MVYFKHPERDIREVGVFPTAEQAQTYYSDWGELDLLRPLRDHGWPGQHGSALAGDSPADLPPADAGTAGGSTTGSLRVSCVEPIWRAQQLPGAQLVQLYSPETGVEPA